MPPKKHVVRSDDGENTRHKGVRVVVMRRRWWRWR
jgi:hypothetical protein